MFFLITGDDPNASLWHRAICDAMEFRRITNSYFMLHPNPAIRGEISKIIRDLGCEDFCELLEHDDFADIDPDFMIYSISKSHDFYNFCIKCHGDKEFSRQMRIGNMRIGDGGFYDRRMSNRSFYEIILLFCSINLILVYLIFFYK